MAVSVVQTATHSGNPPVTFGSNVTAGNTVILIAVGDVSSGTPPTFSAAKLGSTTVTGTFACFNAGTTNAVESASLGGNIACVSVWVLPNCPGGNSTVTLTASISHIGQVAYEVAGLGPTPFLDQTSSGSSTTLTTVSAGTTAAITSALEIVVGASMLFSGAGASSPTGGWTVSHPAGDLWAGQQIPVSSGGTFTWTQTGSGDPWAAGIATIAATPGTTATGSVALAPMALDGIEPVVGTGSLAMAPMGTGGKVTNGPVGGTVIIVAHQDDDCAMLSPDFNTQSTSGLPITTIFLTAGTPNIGDTTTMGEREAGALAAHAVAAGLSAGATWNEVDAGISGHPAPLNTLASIPTHSVIFLRLEEGYITGTGNTYLTSGGNLQNLYTGSASTIGTIDSSSTWNLADLRATLQAFITAAQPSVISTMDFAGNYGDSDHSDHHTSAYLAYDAATAYYKTSGNPFTITAHQGYTCETLPTNVSGSPLTTKTAVISAYETASSGVSNPPAALTPRQYIPQTATFPRTGVYQVQQTVASHNGQFASVSGTGTSTGSPAYTTGATGEFLVSLYTDNANAGQTITPPAGWTQDTHSVLTSAGFNLGVAYKASTGGAETGSWSNSGAALSHVAATTALKLSAGSFTYIQSAEGTTAATYGTNLTTGTVLLALVAQGGGTDGIAASVDDGAGHSMVKIGEAWGGTNGIVYGSIWALATPGALAGTTPTFTVTPSDHTYGVKILVQEVSGITAVADAVAGSMTVTLPAASTAGSSLVAVGRTTASGDASTAILPTAIADSGSNTWNTPSAAGSNPPAIALPDHSSAFVGWATGATASATAVTVSLPAGAAVTEISVSEWQGVSSFSASGTVDNSVAGAEVVGPSLAIGPGTVAVGIAYPASRVVNIGTIGLPYMPGSSSSPAVGGVFPLGGRHGAGLSVEDTVNWAAWQQLTSAGSLAWDWGTATDSVQAAIILAPATATAGSVALAPMALGGTAGQQLTAAGSVAMAPMALSGSASGGAPVTTTGSVALAAMAEAASGVTAPAGSAFGSLALASMALAGTAQILSAGLALAPMRMTGSVTVPVPLFTLGALTAADQATGTLSAGDARTGGPS